MKFITQSILLILFFVIFFHGSYAINLQDIIANEDTDQAISMIQNGEYLGSVTEKKGMTAFHLAAYKGNFRVCKEIFLKDSSYMNKFTSVPFKRTPLLYAIHGFHELNHQPTVLNAKEKAEEYIILINWLVDNGAKTFQRDEYGRNSMQLALQFGLNVLIPNLASNKACTASSGTSSMASDKYDHQNYKNWNGFHYAAYTRYRFKMISNLMLKEGVDSIPKLREYFGLVWGSEYNDISESNLSNYDVVRDDIWNIVSTHSLELTKNFVTSCSNEFEQSITDSLLSKNDLDFSPLDMAVDAGDSIILEYLLTNFVIESENLSSLMFKASLRGYSDCIKVLLKFTSTCSLDEFGRKPSEMWHVKHQLPESLLEWENNNCLVKIDSINHNDNLNIQTTQDCTIDIIDISDINAETFKEKYLSLRKPVLIKNAVSYWSANEKWSTNYFIQEYGTAEVWMGTIPYAPQFGLPGKKGPLNQYGRYVSLYATNEGKEMMKDKPIMYVFDNELLTSPQGKGLFDDIDIPSIVKEYNWNVAQFMWGPPSSGAPLHYHQDAWNGLVFGEKKWWFYPPSETISSIRITDTWESAYYCTQTPGDFVYVPDAWSHAIYNTDFTAAVAIEFQYP